jgi:hypothetical protein
MPKTHNRVRELTTSSGYDNIQLQGAVNGFSSFSSFLMDEDEVYYFLLYNGGYEIGIGTYNENFISRDIITYSSVDNQKLLLPQGEKTIFCTIPGKYAVTTIENNLENYIPVFSDNNSLVQSSISVNGSELNIDGLRLVPSGNSLLFLNNQDQLIELDFANIGSGGDIDIDVDSNGSEEFIDISINFGDVFISYGSGQILNKPIILGNVLTTRDDFVLQTNDGDFNPSVDEDSQGFFNTISSNGNGISIGVDNIISNDSICCGIFNASIGRASSSYGFRVNTIGNNNTIFGYNSTLYGKNSLLIGNNTFHSGDNSLVIGNGKKSTQPYWGFNDDYYSKIVLSNSGMISFGLSSNNYSNMENYLLNNKHGTLTFFKSEDTIYIGYKEKINSSLEELTIEPLFINNKTLTKNILINEVGPFEYYSEKSDSGKTLIYNDINNINFYVSDLNSDIRVIQMGSGDITFLNGNMEVKNYNNHYKTKGPYSQVLLSPVGGLLAFLSGDVENA